MLSHEPLIDILVRDYLTGASEVPHGFIKGNLKLIGQGLERDCIVTAVRSALIPGFSEFAVLV